MPISLGELLGPPPEFRVPDRREARSNKVGAFNQRYSQASAPESDAGFMSDTGNLSLAGLAQLAQGAGYLTGLEGIEDWGREAAQARMQRLSPEMQEALANEFVTYDEEEGYGIGPALTETPLRSIYGALVQSLPATAAGMGVGGAAAMSLGALGRGLAARGIAGGATLARPAVSGAVGFGAGEGAVSAGIAGSDVKDFVMNADAELLSQSPRFQEYVNQGMTVTEAREATAVDVASNAARGAGAVVSLLGAPMGAVFGRWIGGQAPETVLRGIGMGAAGEAAQEAGQSAGEDYSTGTAMSEIDPSQAPTLASMANAAVGGALAGGVMGGGLGGVSSYMQRSRAARQRSEKTDELLDAGGVKRKASIDNAIIEEAADNAVAAKQEAAQQEREQRQADAGMPQFAVPDVAKWTPGQLARSQASLAREGRELNPAQQALLDAVQTEIAARQETEDGVSEQVEQVEKVVPEEQAGVRVRGQQAAPDQEVAEVPDAEEIQGDAGQVQEGRVVGPEGEGEGGTDFQQPAPPEPAARGEEAVDGAGIARAEGEGRVPGGTDTDTPVPPVEPTDATGAAGRPADTGPADTGTVAGEEAADGALGFVPTHRLADDTPVRATGEPNEFVDERGGLWVDEDAAPIAETAGSSQADQVPVEPPPTVPQETDRSLSPASPEPGQAPAQQATPQPLPDQVDQGGAETPSPDQPSTDPRPEAARTQALEPTLPLRETAVPAPDQGISDTSQPSSLPEKEGGDSVVRTEYPFGEVPKDVQGEGRFYGSRVRVSPQLRGEQPWEGTVQRVLNGGRLLEVQPDGTDTSFRIGGDRVNVLETVDQQATTPTPEALPSDQDAVRPDPGVYRQPRNTSSVQAQQAMAGRASRIAMLKPLNERAGSPYLDEEIENAADDRIDAMRDYLVSRQRGTTPGTEGATPVAPSATDLAERHNVTPQPTEDKARSYGRGRYGKEPFTVVEQGGKFYAVPQGAETPSAVEPTKPTVTAIAPTDYKPRKPPAKRMGTAGKTNRDWFKANLRGREAWSNGHIMTLIPPDKVDQKPVEPNTRAATARLRAPADGDRTVPRYRTDDEFSPIGVFPPDPDRSVYPVGAASGLFESGFVSLDHPEHGRKLVGKHYFDHFVRNYPDAKFFSTADAASIAVESNGELVGVIANMRMDDALDAFVTENAPSARPKQEQPAKAKPKAAQAEAEGKAGKLTPEEARKRIKWVKMGTEGGVTTHQARFTDEDGREITVATVSKPGARSPWRVEDSDPWIEPDTSLAKVKKAAIEGEAIPRLVDQGYVAIDDTRYSRAEPARNTTAAVRAELNLNPRAERALLDSGLVTIVQSASEIPGSHPADVAGAYHQGKIYLVADNIPAGRARGLLYHEAGVHANLETMVGAAQYAQIVETLKRQVREGSKPGASRAAREAFQAHLRASADSTVTNPDVLWQETIAYLAEAGSNAPVLRRIMAAVRAFLRRLGLASDFTAADMAHLARGSVQRLVEGMEAQGRPATMYHRNEEALQAIQDAQGATQYSRAPATDTAAFRNWFGDSKVVDEDGNPLVVYHGPRDDFFVFRENPRGMFFTSSDKSAARYGTRSPMPVFLALKNPLEINAKWHFWNELDMVDDAALKALQSKSDKKITTLDHLRPIAEKAGYDGVIVRNVTDNSGTENQYIAFRPEQIKSAIGNIGTFDPGNPDIRYSRAPADLTPRATLGVSLLARNQGDVTAAKREARALYPGMAEDIGDWIEQNKDRWQEAAEGQADTLYSRTPPTPYEEENARIRGTDKTLWDKAMVKLKRQLAPGGNLPRDVFRTKIERDSEFKVIEVDVRNNIAHLEDAVQAVYGQSLNKLPDETKRELYDAIAKKVPSDMDDRLKEEIYKIRGHVDRLSTEYTNLIARDIEKLLAEGKDEAAAVKVDLLNTIQSHIGEYLHRSYQAFDDPKWAERVPDNVINDARDYILAEYEAKAAKYDDWAAKADKKGNGEKADKHRATAAEWRDKAEVRADKAIELILKEGTAYDTMHAFIRESQLGRKDLTILMKRKEIAPEIRALLGEYIDPRLNYAKTATKLGRLIHNQHFLDKVLELGEGTFLFRDKFDSPLGVTTKIGTGEGYEPLADYYTTPEIKQAFIDALGKNNNEAEWYRKVVQWNGAVKYGLTVLSPTTAVRNWMSALFFTVANGHFDLREAGPAFQAFREYRTNKDRGKFFAYLQRLNELGVVYDTPYAGEMMRLLEESKIEDIIAPRWKQPFRSANNTAQKFYQFGDDFWKIIGYENEKRILAKYREDLTAREIEEMAAERIRNTYPTYSMTGRFLNTLRRFPLAGTFVSFPAEIIRTTSNILWYLKEDMKNPQMRPLAMRRAFGLATAAGFAHGLQAIFMMMLGVDDDEEEAFRVMAAPWQQNSNILPISRDEKGNLMFVDLSYVDPYNYWKRPINAILRDQPFEDELKSAAVDALSPFFGPDIAAGAIFEILTNQTDTGRRVFNPEDTVVKQTGDILTHMATSIQPGFANNLSRMVDAVSGEVSPSGQKRTIPGEMAALLGQRVTTFDPKVALYYNSFEFKDVKTNATNILTSVASDPNPVSDRELRSAFERAMKARERGYEKMHTIIRAAKESGMKRAQIARTLRNSQVSKADIGYLLRGITPPWRPSSGFMSGAMRKSSAIYTPEIRREINHRVRTIANLAREQQYLQ